MQNETKDAEFSTWFSTYGLITSQRILNYFNIVIPDSLLIAAIKKDSSFYHRLVQVPLKNVLNGIILQQANDYQVYIQKLFVDYLLSGEGSMPDGAQGSGTRDGLEDERKALVKLGEEFNEQQLNHERIISITQKSLIELSQNLSEAIEASLINIYSFSSLDAANLSKSKIKQSLVNALIAAGSSKDGSFKQNLLLEETAKFLNIREDNRRYGQLEEALYPLFAMLTVAHAAIEELLVKVNESREAARTFRTKFYQDVLRILELIQFLPDYRIDPVKDAINRENLLFDKNIGEN